MDNRGVYRRTDDANRRTNEVCNHNYNDGDNSFHTKEMNR